MTPPEVLAYRDRGKPDGPGWSIRCVPNEFPALERVGEVREHRDGPFVSVDGVGAHEIVVESPNHHGHLATFDDRQIEQVLRAYRERYHDLAADGRSPRARSIGISRSRPASRRSPASNEAPGST
ncbi:MAG TPA: galactose-1-phosphate uridylyltransferase, partial [Thermoplasmata archaeon]